MKESALTSLEQFAIIWQHADQVLQQFVIVLCYVLTVLLATLHTKEQCTIKCVVYLYYTTLQSVNQTVICVALHSVICYTKSSGINI